MSDREMEVLSRVNRQLFIGGKWVDSSSGATYGVEDPATNRILADVADATAEDAIAALDAASAAFDAWAETPPRARAEVIRRAFEIIMERQEDLALLMTMEMGKPLSESRGEVAYAAEFFRWFAEEAVRIDGRYYVAPDGNSRVLTMKQPVGPTYMITPWNFPLAMGTRKIGPALAAGCTVVLKPAEQTPFCSLALAQILTEAGLPGGVVNVINTTSPGPITDALVADPRLRKLSFTGSTEVGRMLVAKSATNLLRVSMELGGNAPFIVFDDADLDLAVDGAMVAKMRNMGEACTSANRFLVSSTVAEAFADKLAARMGGMRVGRGTEEGIQVGPLIDAAAVAKVQGLVKDAVARGAKLVTGGDKLEGAGHFFAPTVLTNVNRDARISAEEIFGPVASIVTFDSEEEAIRLANSTEYGLVAYVFSQSLSRSLRVIEKLETGMVGLNQGLVSNAAAPFGGVKHSGFGREGGFEGIEEYLALKYVAINHRA
ncbi:MAG: NAD-dependent succinate-semialdehyde dehydrogenase [Actinomycetota bacterium]|nr:NAD-dependent succinate-semialdehyde dehydrogenase [Actinomycetota bacterium]